MLTKERKGEIALAVKKAEMRKSFSFQDIANLKRQIGNVVKERELVAIEATSEEILELSKSLLEEVFTEQMKAI